MLEEINILFFLLQMLLLLGAARGLGELFRKYGQPAIAAEVLVGVVFGPTVLGQLPFLHDYIFRPSDTTQFNMLETVSLIGVLFLLLSSGLDVDLSVAWKQRKNSFIIAISDIIIPLMLGFAAAMLIPDALLADSSQRMLFAVFVGTALTISDLPIALRALHDINILRSDLGLMILSALTINDIIGWVLFAITLGLATGGVSIAYVLGVPVGTIAFTAFCLLIGRHFVDRALVKLDEWKLPQPSSSLSFIVLLGLLCGFITHLMHIHALFGFFIAGIMAATSKSMSERTREIIHQMVHSIFVPLFFVSIGLRVNFLQAFNIPVVILLTVVGILGRFLGAYIGTLQCNVARHDRAPVAVSHTPSGAMGIVVASLALQLRFITNEVYVGIVFAAIASSLLVGPWLAYSLKRIKRASILDMFAPASFVVPVKAEESFALIGELSRAIAQETGMPDAATIEAAVKEREETKTTALGQGVACPHARLAGLRMPRVVLGISHAGMDWNSPDGLPVKFIFMILTPDEDLDSQVKILSGIAKTMMQTEVRERLSEVRTREQAWNILRKALQAQQQ